MTDPDAQPVPASPLCRVGISTFMRHDLARDGVCARCGWKVPGLLAAHHRSEPEPEQLTPDPDLFAHHP